MHGWPIPGTTKDQKGNRKDSLLTSASGSSEAAEGCRRNRMELGGKEMWDVRFFGRVRKLSENRCSGGRCRCTVAVKEQRSATRVIGLRHS
jgi:hypothetical protein